VPDGSGSGAYTVGRRVKDDARRNESANKGIILAEIQCSCSDMVKLKGTRLEMAPEAEPRERVVKNLE